MQAVENTTMPSKGPISSIELLIAIVKLVSPSMISNKLCFILLTPAQAKKKHIYIWLCVSRRLEPNKSHTLERLTIRSTVRLWVSINRHRSQYLSPMRSGKMCLLSNNPGAGSWHWSCEGRRSYTGFEARNWAL